VRSKADISQLNLPHGTDNKKKCKKQKKIKSKKTDMLRSNSKQSGKSTIVNPEGEKGKRPPCLAKLMARFGDRYAEAKV